MMYAPFDAAQCCAVLNGHSEEELCCVVAYQLEITSAEMYAAFVPPCVCEYIGHWH